MTRTGRPHVPLTIALVGAALFACSSSTPGTTAKGDGGDASCFPDNDGIPAGTYNFDITVDDTGFSKMLLTTQNSAAVTLKLTNTGTKPHGFKVECTSVTPAYPTVPAGCSTTACFDPSGAIAPLAPGASATIMFETPVPDGLIYPFDSNEPDDKGIAGLNDGQWSLM
jgi:hypothetical protein